MSDITYKGGIDVRYLAEAIGGRQTHFGHVFDFEKHAKFGEKISGVSPISDIPKKVTKKRATAPSQKF